MPNSPMMQRSTSRLGVSSRVRAGTTALASLAVLAALLASPTGASAAPDAGPSGDKVATELEEAEAIPAEEDGLLVDAASYARDYDVDVEEAAERLVAQAEYGELVERLATTFPDTFAGSDIDHGHGYALLLYFTADQDAEAVNQEIAAGPELSRPQVRIDTAALLNSRDSTVLVEAIEIPSSLDGLVDGLSYNPATNNIEFDVLSSAAIDSTEAMLNAQTADAAKNLNRPVPGIVVRGKETGASDGHSGGLHLTSCTSGFAVKVGSTEGLSTAGHCGNTQSYKNYSSSNWYALTYKAEKRNATADVQWHTTNIGVYPRFIASSESTYRTVTGKVTRANQNGDYICHRGKATGYSCGTVQSNAYKLTYSNACNGVTCSATWVRTTGSSLECYPGDSGGVVFNSGLAYGLYKGQTSSGTSASACTEMYHMPIDYLSGISATLLVG